MTEKKPKSEKLKIETRVPQKRGIFDNLGKGKQENVKHPFSEIINFPEVSSLPEETLPSTVSQPSTPTPDSQPSTVSIPTLPSTVSTIKRKRMPIAPEKDFSRVANSVVREVAKGSFTGKSKQMYDYLYSLTRAAIVPKLKVRISKPKLMRGAGIGSPQTFYRNVEHLELLGLIKKTGLPGEHAGNEYEVFLPEEINLEIVDPVQSDNSVQSVQSVESPQKQVVLLGLETELGVPSSESINTEGPSEPKTSFKDNIRTDDEALVSFTARFEAASTKLTGKGLSKRESDKWEALADLLILELEVAAARSGGVSSVPAFLTEVLRRQFFAARQKPAAKSEKVKPDTVGKSDSGTYEIKPLDQAGREAALEQLREFAGDELLQGFEKWYTAEDWQWLTEKLK